MKLMLYGYGIELAVTNLARTPRKTSAMITVQASDGVGDVQGKARPGAMFSRGQQFTGVPPRWASLLPPWAIAPSPTR